jgi:hypothetical protein
MAWLDLRTINKDSSITSGQTRSWMPAKITDALDVKLSNPP